MLKRKPVFFLSNRWLLLRPTWRPISFLVGPAIVNKRTIHSVSLKVQLVQKKKKMQRRLPTCWIFKLNSCEWITYLTILNNFRSWLLNFKNLYISFIVVGFLLHYVKRIWSKTLFNQVPEKEVISPECCWHFLHRYAESSIHAVFV